MLLVSFNGYTDECEEVVIGICQKMGATVRKIDNEEDDRMYVIVSSDDEIKKYIEYLGTCDLIGIR